MHDQHIHQQDLYLRVAAQQVVNDLLNATGAGLRLRETSQGGCTVDGLSEATLLNFEHALRVVAAGNAVRKVCPTWLGRPNFWPCPMPAVGMAGQAAALLGTLHCQVTDFTARPSTTPAMRGLSRQQA